MKIGGKLRGPLLVLTGVLALSGCGATKMAKDLPDEEQSRINDVTLERRFQRVVKYDCARRVISDGIETVSSPTEWISIEPDDPRNLSGSEFVNRTTGSRPSWVVDHSDFQIDYSFGALNMHVVSGINIIDYKFYGCSPGTPSGTCSNVIEKGTVTINVLYSEIHLGGILEVDGCVRPSPTP